MILRHPWVIGSCVVLCISVALAYVRVATPLYTSSASLRVQQGSPPVLGSPEPPHSSDETVAFLNAELAVVASSPVLEATLASPTVRLTHPFQAAADPVVALRKELRLAVGRKDGIISIEFDAPSPAAAAALVNSLVKAYIAHETRQKEDLDQRLLTILAKERAQCIAATRGNSERMVQILNQAGTFTLDNRDRVQELSALRTTLHAAQSEAASAQSQYEETASALQGDAELMAQLERMKATKIIPANAEAETAQLRLAIAELELKKQEMLSRRYLPSHPQFVSMLSQLDRLRLMLAASSHGRWVFASQRAAQLQEQVRQQEAFALNLGETASLYAQTEVELKRAEHQLNTVDERIREIEARRGSEGLHIAVVEEARPSLRPTKPDVPRLLAMAAALGLCIGALGAYLREVTCLRRADNRSEPRPQTSDDSEAVLRLSADAMSEEAMPRHHGRVVPERAWSPALAALRPGEAR